MKGVAKFDNFADNPRPLRPPQRTFSPFKLLAIFADWFDQRGTYVPSEVNEPLTSRASIALFIVWWVTFCVFILVIALVFH